MEFSKRTRWDLAETSWARRLSVLRASGARVLDLTASNPTRCGFQYPSQPILAALADPQALVYDPDPRGTLRARQAVALYYSALGVAACPEHVLLTVSTSEAYSYLFRLLCDPGDEVLVAQPSYPLFDFLAQLDDVRIAPYELFYDHGWQIDMAGLRRRIGPRAKALALVHPNNPTGHFTRRQERAALENLCREHELSLIVDEVFLDYSFGAPAESFAAGEHPVPTFVLSGISKIAALPQMKAAWIASFGPDRDLAYARLEVISDTFLSMNAPVQHALPAWMEIRHGMQNQIRERTRRNLSALDAALREQKMVSRLEVEAGWYAVLRVPAVAGDEEMALQLLERRSVAVHPGSFFGFPSSGSLVVSLLPREEEFTEAVHAICGFLAGE